MRRLLEAILGPLRRSKFISQVLTLVTGTALAQAVGIALSIPWLVFTPLMILDISLYLPQSLALRQPLLPYDMTWLSFYLNQMK